MVLHPTIVTAVAAFSLPNALTSLELSCKKVASDVAFTYKYCADDQPSKPLHEPSMVPNDEHQAAACMALATANILNGHKSFKMMLQG